MLNTCIESLVWACRRQAVGSTRPIITVDSSAVPTLVINKANATSPVKCYSGKPVSDTSRLAPHSSAHLLLCHYFPGSLFVWLSSTCSGTCRPHQQFKESAMGEKANGMAANPYGTRSSSKVGPLNWVRFFSEKAKLVLIWPEVAPLVWTEIAGS